MVGQNSAGVAWRRKRTMIARGVGVQLTVERGNPARLRWMRASGVLQSVAVLGMG